ncbi:MAG: KpsF/GutQ family sugar-phosphate isomerase [Rhodospirillaceae bacterium]|nr:KpsF/GutQ family sugar-phosphate isomerase [Rhodospirillaceae bacterium]
MPPKSKANKQAANNSKAGDLEIARRVLATERDALSGLADDLGADFVAAIDTLAGIKGRVVVTGMGKSGHVARKIAATMASTGKPSFFVHPGEASHGDLGMIQKEDAVIALSNSGETAELSDIVAYTHRFRIPLIGICGRTDSTLAKASSVSLVVPDAPEACPMGLAPTTSTTVMLALGDAIAVCLLEREGFTAEDFNDFHPGGKLGQRLLKISDLMHGGNELPLINESAPMSEALIEMSAKGFGVVGVINASGKLQGVITDGDLRRNMNPGLIDQKASEVMTSGAIQVSADQLASDAVAIMNERKVTALYITQNDKPVGVLHIHDCLRAGVV